MKLLESITVFRNMRKGLAMREFKQAAAAMAILFIAAATVQACLTSGFTSRTSNRDNDIFHFAFALNNLMPSPPDVNDEFDRREIFDSNGFGSARSRSRRGGRYSDLTDEDGSGTDSQGLPGNIDGLDGEVNGGGSNSDSGNGSGGSVVPAPSALLLLLTGTAFLGAFRKRRR